MSKSHKFDDDEVQLTRGVLAVRRSMSLNGCLNCSSMGAPPAANTDPMFCGK